MRNGMLAGAAIAALGLIASGCGGGDETTTTGATGASGATGAQGAALSKSQFIAKADAICKKGNQTINTTAKDTFGNQKPSAQQMSDFTTKTVIPTIQEEVTGVGALPPPSGDEDQVNAIVDSAQQALDKAKQDPALLQGGSDPFKKTNQLAKDYGLKVCGQ